VAVGFPDLQLDLGKDDHDHLIDPEKRLRVAMSRQ
jgi:hypothetical protein